jgi:hypothetical protein
MLYFSSVLIHSHSCNRPVPSRHGGAAAFYREDGEMSLRQKCILTLDKRELRGRLSAKEFAAADPDNDGTLDKDEFLALVEAKFKAADPDKDGTIDAKELKSSTGKSLSRILK